MCKFTFLRPSADRAPSSQYISGRFSNGYRATIGADFITKTLHHPTDPSQSVTLQIWVGATLVPCTQISC